MNRNEIRDFASEIMIEIEEFLGAARNLSSADRTLLEDAATVLDDVSKEYE